MSRNGPNDDDSVGSLLMQVAGGAFRLLRGEIELRKAEAGFALGFVIRGVVVIVIAIILALLGFGQFADAGHAGLVLAGLSPLGASLATGAILCLTAGLMIWWGQRTIRRAGFLARERRYGLRRDLVAQKADAAQAEQKGNQDDRSS